jgi:hypothetical protein
MEERTSRFVKQSGREKCGPNTDTDAAMSGSRLNVDIIFIGHNVTSFEERMELPKKSMAAFYKRKTSNTEHIVLRSTAARVVDMSTSLIKSFADLEGVQYSTGTAHLSGCTTMYIISR